VVVHHPPLFRLARRLPLLALGALILLAGAACEKRNKITNPQPAPTLAEVWPNDDGHSWTYRSIARAWDPPTPVYYFTQALVPSVTFDSIAAVFATRPAGTNVIADTSVIQLRFNGTTAVAVTVALPEGIPVQVLEETHTPASLVSLPAVLRNRSFLATLASARPDLRERLAGTLAATPSALPSGGFAEPRFVHPGLWRRTAKWIGSHDPADTDTFPDWIFLEADLRPGSSFSMPLVPGLAPEVTLNARVVRSLSLQTPAGYFTGAIEVHYFIDYGVFSARDDAGAFLGWGRQFTCGSVIYVPGVGPVRDDERGLLFAGASRRPGSGDLLLVLTDTAPAK
jgi:hypothetical protein